MRCGEKAGAKKKTEKIREGERTVRAPFFARVRCAISPSLPSGSLEQAIQKSLLYRSKTIVPMPKTPFSAIARSVPIICIPTLKVQ